MTFSIRLRQYSSRVLRLSLKPWVAAVATVTVIFYLAIFSAATIHVADDPRSSKDMQPSGNHSLRQAPDKHPLPAGKPRAPKDIYNYSAFLQQPVINFHNYSYVHNVPDACTKRRINLVIVSPSGPSNFYRRMMARKSGRTVYTGNPGNHATHLFFLGSSRDPEVQRKIAAESKRYTDIIQESYIDIYANITLKAVQMLKWVSLYCGQSKNTIRLDDDVMADMDLLLRAMARAQEKYSHFVLGEVKTGWIPCQIPKCRTTKEEYPHATLPPFALGGALGYPTSSVQRLYEASRRVKRFKLDDVYITGMCAPKVGVKLLHDQEFVFKHDAW